MASSSTIPTYPSAKSSSNLPLSAPSPSEPRKLYTTASLHTHFGHPVTHLTTLNSTLHNPHRLAFVCLSHDPVPNFTEEGQVLASDNLWLLEEVEARLEWERSWKERETLRKKEIEAREKEWDLDAFEGILTEKKRAGNGVDLLTGDQEEEEEEEVVEKKDPREENVDNKWVSNDLIDLGEGVKEVPVPKGAVGTLIDIGDVILSEKDSTIAPLNNGSRPWELDHASVGQDIVWDGYEEDETSSVQSIKLDNSAMKPYLLSPETIHSRPLPPASPFWQTYLPPVHHEPAPLPYIPPPPPEPIIPVFLATPFRLPNSVHSQSAWHCLGWFTISKISYYGPGEQRLAEALSQVIPNEEAFFDLYLKHMTKTWAGITLKVAEGVETYPMEGVEGFWWKEEVVGRKVDGTGNREDDRVGQAKSPEVVSKDKGRAENASRTPSKHVKPEVLRTAKGSARSQKRPPSEKWETISNKIAFRTPW